MESLPAEFVVAFFALLVMLRDVAYLTVGEGRTRRRSEGGDMSTTENPSPTPTPDPVPPSDPQPDK